MLVSHLHGQFFELKNIESVSRDNKKKKQFAQKSVVVLSIFSIR